MANSFIPRADGAAAAFYANFTHEISSNPQRYMLSSADAVAIENVVYAYLDTLRLATQPETRTRSTVCAKDQARNSAESLCRFYASLIKPNRGISEAAKINIGVRSLNRGRQRVNCPSTSPLLKVIGATPGLHEVRFGGANQGGSGKPFGAIALQLFALINDGIMVHDKPDDARLIGTFTRNPMTVPFSGDDDRKKATYWGRWISRRGEVGPWSLPVSMTIAA